MKRCSVYRTPEGVIQLCRKMARWKMMQHGKEDHGHICDKHMIEFKARWPEYEYVKIRTRRKPK